MGKNVKTDDLDPHQERLLREMISKEMIKKIQRRIDGEDHSVMKTFRSMFDETTEKKNKMEGKIKNILKDKQKSENQGTD